MRYKLLGKSGLRVSELCLGTMGFSEGLSWGSSKEESRKIYDAFIEAGGNFIDTSNSYGSSEQWLGEFMGDDRDRVVLATKYTGSILQNDVNSSGNHRKSMVRSVELSLQQLKTDYIDLLWLNAWDFMTPIEEFMRALDDLVRRGKVLYIGISNAPAWIVAQANTVANLHGWTPFIGLQVEYNLLERDIERELLPMARVLDIGITAWTPLASGWLTGKYINNGTATTREQKRLDDPIASGFVQRSERNRSIVEEVSKISGEIGCTPAHVALNWLRHRNVIPIFGARQVKQIKENQACLKFHLSEEHIHRLNEVSKIQLGYPHAFLASSMVKRFMYGGMFELIDNHRC